jgi:hypothetical protein
MSDYAEGVSALRTAADRNWAKIEFDLAQLRQLFQDSDEQIARMQCPDATPSRTHGSSLTQAGGAWRSGRDT